MKASIFDGISRFKNPNYYSKNSNKCIQEFLSDVSKVYTSGMPYDEVLNNSTIKKVHRALAAMHQDNHFPFIDKFINFVYTRDEVFNPLGNWLHFEYLEPLILLEFVINRTKDKKRQRISYTELASLVFISFQFTNLISEEQYLLERKKLNPLINSFADTVKKQKVRKILTATSLYDDRPPIFTRPNDLYEMIGISDYRTLKTLCDLLDLDVGHTKKRSQEYKSAVILGNVDRIREAYKYFRKQNFDRYELIRKYIYPDIANVVCISDKTKDKVLNLYSNILIHDSQMPAIKCLENNPLIKIHARKKRLHCHIQSKVFNFNMILCSLFIKRKSKRSFLIDPIDENVDSKIKSIILGSREKFNELALEEKLTLLVDGINPKPITSPLLKESNLHFEQIEESKPIINDISNNGILINVDAIKKILKGLRIQENPINAPDEEDESATARIINPSEDSSNDFYTFKELKDLTDQDELNALKYYRDFAWRYEKNKNHAKLYGIFSSHAASTHRMTCRRINLQGINKEIKREIQIARPGWCLLSADVSGQDITVAANLAKKLYDNPSLFENEVMDQLTICKNKISQTLRMLSDESLSEHKPVDFITDNVIASEGVNLNGMTHNDVRNSVKKAIYTMFYGGSKVSFLDSVYTKSRLTNESKELIAECIQFERAFIYQFIDSPRANIWAMKRSYTKLNNPDKIRIIKEFLLLCEDKFPLIIDRYIFDANQRVILRLNLGSEIAKLRSECIRLERHVEKRISHELIFDKMVQIVNITYPGILESFAYYEKYYKMIGLTFPTFLGWQTVVNLDYVKKEISTRSKSYPVQAGSAEFIRQWLIELQSSLPKPLTGKEKFRIVNVIHDQVIIEVKNSLKRTAEKHLLISSKRAARAIGVDPNTLHIPRIEQLYPKN